MLRTWIIVADYTSQGTLLFRAGSHSTPNLQTCFFGECTILFREHCLSTALLVESLTNSTAV